MQSRTTICRQPGCGLYTDGPLCPAHTTDNAVTQYDKNRDKNDPVRKLYWQARWRGPHGLQKFLLAKNPQCQKLELVNGVLVQCLMLSTCVHHLRDPKEAPQLFLTASNCVCLCEGRQGRHGHHPGGLAGTPHWKVAKPGDKGQPGEDYYVATVASHNL
jgi:hypothetical protein